MYKFFCILLTLIILKNSAGFAVDYFQIEGRVSAFCPTSKIVRQIYANVMANYEIEASATFCAWQPWIGVGYLTQKGHSIGLNDPTRLQLVPVTAGIKYLIPVFECANAYVGAGAVYSFLKIRDHSPFVHEHVSKSTWGGTAKIGVEYFINQYFFVDVFADYIYQKFHFKTSQTSEPFVVRHDADLSAFKFGAGIGINF